MRKIAFTKTHIIISTILIALSAVASDFIPIFRPGLRIIYQHSPTVKNSYDYSNRGLYTIYPSYDDIKDVFIVEGDTIINNQNCKTIRHCNRIRTGYFYISESTDGFIAYRDDPHNGQVFNRFYRDAKIGDVGYEQFLYTWGPGGNGYYNYEYEVLHINEVILNGFPRKRIVLRRRLDNFVDKFQYAEYIDGVGFWDENKYDSKFALNTNDAMENMVVSEIWDGDKLIFSREELFPQYHFIHTVRPDRIWIYGGIDENGNPYKSYCKFSDVTIIDDVPQYVFHEFKRMTWDNLSLTGSAIESNNNIPSIPMYESCGIVYAKYSCRNENREWEEYMDVYNYKKTPYSMDYLENEYYPSAIYVDNEYFGLCVFAMYNDYWQLYGPLYYPANIFSTWKQYIAGEERDVYQYDGDQLNIEGIGVDRGGFLPYIYRDQERFDNTFLLEYCDTMGNTLHKFHNLENIVASKIPSDIQQVKPDDNSPRYDLMGRRITSPSRGQIYIQNGKKFIAK